MTILSHRLAAAMTILLLTAGGCSSQTRIEKLYQNPDHSGTPYERLLVIGIAGDPGQRRLIEDLLSASFAANNVASAAGHTQFGSSPVVLQDEIDEAAAASHSDAILIAHLVSVSAKPEVVKGRTEIKSECRGGNPIDYFLYDHEEIREPDSVAIAREVVMVTNLYDAGTGARIWTIQSTCFEKSDFDAILAQEAQAIVRQLRRDRLIVPTAD